MSVHADAAHEQIDPAVRRDLLLIPGALTLGIIRHAVQNIDILGLHVDQMIKEFIMHEIPVALIMLVRQPQILIHIKSHDISERELARLVHPSQFFIYSDWA